MLLVSLRTRETISPRTWCKYRGKEWWSEVVAGIHGATFWRENFRMSHDTFSILCEELRPHLGRQTTKFRVPVSVDASCSGFQGFVYGH